MELNRHYELILQVTFPHGKCGLLILRGGGGGPWLGCWLGPWLAVKVGWGVLWGAVGPAAVGTAVWVPCLSLWTLVEEGWTGAVSPPSCA